ncbi:MAG: glycosyl hydrolase family 28 protein [Cyclobacteriaceae bacterium]|jgi:hypothetical protein|nr:glycosyl hydrolase family 28 protein [Cyclobacteriaceae bacterium]
MKKSLFNIAIIFALIIACACKQRTNSNFYSITDFGAIGDSITINTQAIQKAIDACASSGGGTVYFPSGVYLTGTLKLKSNIHYQISKGATLLGSGNIADYNKPEGENNMMLISNKQEKVEVLQVLIDGTDVENITFSGGGKISGNGDKFWNAEFVPAERPTPWISFKNAKHIQIREIQFNNAPSHVLRFAKTSNIVIDGISINNHPKSPNTDGIDIVDSQNVSISNSFISTGDDAICLKTDVGGIVENVVVNNCIIESDDAAIKFGTGSVGIIRFCSFSNNVIRKSRYGISLFMLEGGTFEHNLFSNMIFSGGSRHKHEYGIFIDVDKKRLSDAYGTINHNTFSNLHFVSSGKIMITGRPENNITNLTLKDISFIVEQEANFAKASKPRGNKNFPKLESSIDRASVPANITLAYISSLTLQGIEIQSDKTGTRRDIDLLEVKNLKASGNRGNDIEKLK